MNTLALLHAWQTTDKPEAVLADLARQPHWPMELGVFLGLKLPPLDSCVWEERPNLEGLASRIEETVARRFGPEQFKQLWQAVTLFSIPNRVFANQGFNYFFLMREELVELCAKAARSVALVIVGALRLDPSLLDAFGKVADAVWSQYRVESLPASGEQAFGLDVAACHFILGTIHRNNRPEEAERRFRRFLELSPRQCPDNNWPLEPSYFPRMRHSPSSVAAWAELGRLTLQFSGDRRQARKCFRKAIQLDPQSQEAPYQDLGRLLEKEGRIRPALLQYRKSIKVRSRALLKARSWEWFERPYRRELAELCLRMVPYVAPGEARVLLRRALRFDPDDAQRWLVQLTWIFTDMPELGRQRTLCARALRLGEDIFMDGMTSYEVKVDMRFRALFLEIAESFLGERRGYTKALAWCRLVRIVNGDSPELLLRQIELIETYLHDHWQVVPLCERFLTMKPDDLAVRRRWERAKKAIGQEDVSSSDLAGQLDPRGVARSTWVLVLTPRRVQAAAQTAERLQREAWLDTPFVFYSHREYDNKRVEQYLGQDWDEFSPEVMCDVIEIKNVLSKYAWRVLHERLWLSPPEMGWRFYPQTTVDGMEAVLAKFGYRLLIPDLTHAGFLPESRGHRHSGE